MVRVSGFVPGFAAAAVVGSAAAAPRYVLYLDEWHTAVLPNKTMTAGITHVHTSFANSSNFYANSPLDDYTPFMSLSDVRALFDNGTKVCMSIGGWGDTDGFRIGAASNASRSAYARNIANTLDRLGYDCVEVDWEYPGGDGADYKQISNSQLTSEIQTYPLLLQAIKSAIGDKELSTAVPGLQRDMIAFTEETVPQINAAVDYINVMTYDLMNRRDTATKHHTDVNGSLSTIETYMSLGMSPAKMNLGLAFYAKYFTLAANTTCVGPIGCPIALAELPNGDDAGNSGALTFEASSFPNDGGDDTTTNTAKSVAQSFADALANGETDTVRGGQWWVDDDAALFWTWDTPELVARKFTDIVEAKGLGGVMAWSLGEDSYDWALLKAAQDGVAQLNKNYTSTIRRRARY